MVETSPSRESPASPSEGGRRTLADRLRALPWALVGLGAWVAPLAAGGLSYALGGGPRIGGPLGVLLSILLAPAFLGVLGAELLGAALWFTRSRPLPLRTLLSAPGALVLFAIGAAIGGGYERAFFLAGGAFVVGWFVVLLQYVYRHKQLELQLLRYAVEVSFFALFVLAGWFLWALDASPYLLAVTGLAAPFVLARSVARPSSPGRPAERVSWLTRPFWVFELLLFTFLTEFFLGALLDLEVAGRGFLGYIPFLSLSGTAGAFASAAVYDGLWFAAAVLASAWFLVSIGVTMGALVVLRMRETHVPAQRYRMGLMLGVYALAAVFLPSLASSTPLVSNQTLASLPVVGWGFGLRAGGPFEAGIFLAVLVMYALVGVLTVLFGRKALCSVMCGAALMYQGTAVNEMREFHQTSRVGQYFLGSRLSTAYAVMSGVALVSLFGVSLLAFLHRLPMVQLGNGELDTAALPLPIELYFGAVWFVMFVSTPYIGTYNCVSTGFCHWGALSIPFAKASLFRLKVKDKKVCQACTTFDCAKSCPVGLVDMPLYFRATGEFRSTKCCGVGDCVGACPYNNLYHQDVRFWILRGLKRLSRDSTPTPLPMVRPGAAAGPVPPAVPEAVARGPN